MDLSLWSTYWPGITEEICGGTGSSRKLTATSALQTMEPSSLVITARQTDQGYTEACYWQITANTDNWVNGAEIYIYLD